MLRRRFFAKTRANPFSPANVLALRDDRTRSLVLALALGLALAPASTLAPAPLAAAETRWLRYPAISPDGRQIAFGCHGDLWIVPAAGGAARPLTSHVGYEKAPVWSPDGRFVAFAADWHTQFDVYLAPVGGGPARRLTHHSADDSPSDFSPDGQRVLFTSRRLDAPEATFNAYTLPELYSVPVGGGPPRLELTTPAELARVRPDGKAVVYHDQKGYENPWRKHHRSSVARDVWLWDLPSGRHTRLTDFPGEDRNPVWAPDGASIFYLGEASGSFNVWRLRLAEPAKPTQITRHDTHPVRFLSCARDGSLAYGYNGDIYLQRPGGEPTRVAIEVAASDRRNAAEEFTFRDGAVEFALAPSEEEIAFVVRGEVFVASVEHGETRRVTFTPEQERSVCWSPRGDALYYAAERGASWGLYRCRPRAAIEERFFLATGFVEEPVLVDGAENFQPLVSPDGQQLAFLRNRDALCVLDLATGKHRELVPGGRNYSYSDGDIQFAWSPDSRWLAFNYLPHRRWTDEVGVARVATGEITNLSESGYWDGLPHWSRDGRSLLFLSDRQGRRNHGSWGSDVDVFSFSLTRAAHDRALLSFEDYQRLVKKEEKQKADEEKAKAREKDPAASAPEALPREAAPEAAPPEAAPIEIEWAHKDQRLLRWTLFSAPIESCALSPDGESLVYLAQAEAKWDLWVSRRRQRQTRKLLALQDDEAGQVVFAKDGKSLFLRRGNGKIEKVDVSGALADNDEGGGGKAASSKPVKFAAVMETSLPAERAYLFEHVWRQAAAKFYDPKLHGVDWAAHKANHAALLPSITNNHDFAELLSEMLGELNASHTGAGYRLKVEPQDETASLGLLYDPRFAGPGLRVAEVLVGGPADRADARLAPGVVITHIDGQALGAAVNPNALLAGRAGQRLRLAARAAAGPATWDEVLKPISLADERELLYHRWIRRNAELADKHSGGKVGYVHVRGMRDDSFRDLFHEALGRHSDKQALLVDTRYNGGGWLHDDLVRFLQGRDYLRFTPRGKNPGDFGQEPWARWTRPVAVLMGEGNYSDAHMFPYAFKTLGLGKLVGAPVPGTATAVWWETLIDRSLYFGIPQVGMVTLEGQYLENLQLEPDVLVLNTPEQVARGDDQQLRRGVETLLQEIQAQR